ncbi:hypothetical protein [Lysobacter gummosus]
MRAEPNGAWLGKVLALERHSGRLSPAVASAGAERRRGSSTR